MKVYPQWNKSFSINESGKDYFVGDIHGQLDELELALDLIEFDREKDRLFAVGDLINRGPNSPGCLDLLTEPWFFSVSGNHELMFIGAMTDPLMQHQFTHVGGKWLYQESNDKLEEYFELVLALTSLSMTIATPWGSIGVVHACAPSDWQLLANQPSDRASHQKQWHQSIWSFEQGNAAKKGDYTRIKNIDWVVSGHISTKKSVKSINQVWIDTFAHGDGFTILSAEEIFNLKLNG